MTMFTSFDVVYQSTITALSGAVGLFFSRQSKPPRNFSHDLLSLSRDLDDLVAIKDRDQLLRRIATCLVRHADLTKVTLLQGTDTGEASEAWEVDEQGKFHSQPKIAEGTFWPREFGMSVPLPLQPSENTYLLAFSREPRTGFKVVTRGARLGELQSLIAMLIVRTARHVIESIPLAATEPNQRPIHSAHDADHKNFNRLLKLVRHRKQETLVGEILSFVNQDLKMHRVAYWYQTADPGKPVKVATVPDKDGLVVPDLETLIAACNSIASSTLATVEDLKSKMSGVSHWPAALQRSGFRHVLAFNLSEGRQGLLACQYMDHSETIKERIHELQLAARELVANAESFEAMEQLSYTDPLTRLANSRYFTKRLAEELDRARRFGRQVGLIIFDLDDLKVINDTHGHLAGDAVLRSMGDILRRSIRTIDIIARYGGDEFCVVMPDADAETCLRFMHRLRLTIQSSAMRLDGNDKTVKCTISLGGSLFPQHADTPEKLLYVADMALLKAKETGRNRYVLHEHNG